MGILGCWRSWRNGTRPWKQKDPVPDLLEGRSSKSKDCLYLDFPKQSHRRALPTPFMSLELPEELWRDFKD